MKCLHAVLSAILLAGVNATPVSHNEGDEFTFTVLAFPSAIQSCHLKTPQGDTLDFIPGEASSHGDRYELLPISSTMASCSVRVKSLQESDSGTWEVSFVSPTGTGNSQEFELVVTGTEIQEAVEENDGIEWLTVIEHPTRTGQNIDISLPRISQEETCSIRSPDGRNIRASELTNIDGVTAHSSSIFVSCRITIGPMDEDNDLIGDWAVCGEFTENIEEHKRCQPVKIYWNNANRPDTIWGGITQPAYDHPVNYGKTLAPTVIGEGEVISCHVVTPDGEDLVITQDSNYPYLRAQTIAHSICNVAIGPITEEFLGDWTIYGMFRSSVTGLNEVRLPFRMFLYDDKNPYDQAYNVTNLGTVKRVVNSGNTLYTEVSVSAGHVDDCQFETPSGDIYTIQTQHEFTGASFVEAESGVVCQLAIGPITTELLGDWKVIGKFSNNGIFSELQQTFYVIKEDPENPIEEDRDIHYFVPQLIRTEIGGSHRLTISSDVFINAESCHIRNPDGFQYTIMEGFSLEGVEVIEESGVECGVVINVVSEDVIGEWTLIARATRFSEAIERRLPFTINVEEPVEALVAEIDLIKGNDLFVRLKHPTEFYDTCKLIGPDGFECPSAEPDPLHVKTCGFIRKNVQAFNTGTWTIQYVNRKVYKAEISVTVTPESDIENVMTTLDLVRGRSVEKLVGPENAVYCRLEDPHGYAVYDGFGRCTLSLDKVTLEHNGVWKMFVGTPGKVLTQDYQLYVTVIESEGKPVVTTHVEKDQPTVTMSCAVETEAEVHACKFRDPQGRILLAANGISKDSYTHHGNEVSYETEVKPHECSLRITNPLVSDLGLWRCAIETSEDTYYGHLSVLYLSALQDPEDAATVQQVPTLSADRTQVSVVEEQPVILSCSVQAVIRYCYFRAPNGTIFTVTPGMTTPMQYIGAGFDAGECGVRFLTTAVDSGRWSCHVGLVGEYDEQRDQLQLTVHERMRVDHYTKGNVMTVEGVVYESRALEYCRFVRIDGFGFTTDNMPAEYKFTGLLNNGECQITTSNPTTLDLHPWTVVAKIKGQDEEIARDTIDVVLGTPGGGSSNNHRGSQIFIYTFLMILLVSIMMGVCLGPKKNREWTYQRASAFRRSFTNSIRKQPANSRV